MFKGASGEASDISKERVIMHWRKGNASYKVRKNLAELCSSVLWRVELVNDEVGYSAEEVSKQNIEGVTWLLSAAYSKMWEEREKWKKGLLSNNEPELEDLANYQSIHIVKKRENVFWREYQWYGWTTIW